MMIGGKIQRYVFIAFYGLIYTIICLQCIEGSRLSYQYNNYNQYSSNGYAMYSQYEDGESYGGYYQNGGGGGRQDTEAADANYDYYHASRDYGNQNGGGGVVVPVRVKCYTCHFSSMSQHIHGMPHCDEPFKEEGVPVVSCEGACAITKNLLDTSSSPSSSSSSSLSSSSSRDYMLSRSCLPNCKDMHDAYAVVKCCHGNLCNGRVSSKAATLLNTMEIVNAICLLFMVIGFEGL